ncbi:MAG TPA: DUF4386 domain-containing protein [Pyrinomonadaceae bacterium]|jgi:hypothetical protein|nr:DUF4386 domain-containing protein [Pyrinomonadaceae bacterium]
MAGEDMDSSRNRARLAGLLWLLVAVTGGFSLFYVRSKVIVSGDAAATAGNIVASEFLFRAAIVSNLFSQVFLFFFGLIIYRLFKEVNKALATVFLTSVMMTVAIAVVNAFNSFGALLVLSQADYLKAFTTEQLNALAMIFLRLNNSFGQGLLEIFWVPFYFSFGLLIIKSRYLPKILGILMLLMSVGFAINILDKFLIPQFYPALFTRLAMTLSALGVLPTIFWLLIKGAKVQPLDEQAA